MGDSETDEYWRQRYQQFGHTGWKNPYVYEFDQQMRKQLLKETLDELNFDRKRALDFGCGTGDFSRFLLDQGFEVTAYDPYVDPSFNHPKIKTISSKNDLGEASRKFGLILSVTVLNHIVDDDELVDDLNILRDLIQRHGYFVMIEKALDEPPDDIPEHEAGRTTDEMLEILSECGWNVEAIRPVPVPFQTPIKAFNQYLRDPVILFVRSIVKFLNFGRLQPFLRKLSEWRARAYLGGKVVGFTDVSPLKLIVCRPVNE